MKFHITSYELWFWRVGVVVALFLSAANFSDNRQQDHLIFKTIIEQEDAAKMETEILKSQIVIQENIIVLNKAIIQIWKGLPE